MLVLEPAGDLGSGLEVSEGTLGLREGGSRVHPLGGVGLVNWMATGWKLYHPGQP